MAKNIQDALNNVEMGYSQLIEIGNDMLADLFDPINNVVDSIGEDINSLSIDNLKNYEWSLQHKAYQLSEVKEKSLMKAQIAETLRKEKYATQFNEAQGTAAVKENLALIGSSEETVVEVLYDYISGQLKTKVDQLHRIVDVIKNILMTRMQEAKMTLSQME